MTLTDPLRPAFASGHPALLIDGSAVPRLSILPVDETHVELVLMLRAYDASHGYTYEPHRAICDTQALGSLLHDYFLDPEATIANLVGWRPQVPSGRAEPRLQPQRRPLTEEAKSQLDLI